MKITGFWCECGRPRERNSSRGCDRCSWLNGRIHDVRKGGDPVRYLRERGPSTAYQIAEVLGMKPATVTSLLCRRAHQGIVDRLERVQGAGNKVTWVAKETFDD